MLCSARLVGAAVALQSPPPAAAGVAPAAGGDRAAELDRSNSARLCTCRASRSAAEAVRGYATELGLTEIDCLPAFQEGVGGGFVQRTLALRAVDEEAWKVSAQLRERRLHRGVPREPRRQALGLVCLEWRAALGTYAWAWHSQGGEAWATTPRYRAGARPRARGEAG